MSRLFARIGFALGAGLFIVRIAPVVARKPEDVSFPPASTSELIELAVAAGGAWGVAHLLGLVAAALLTWGYWSHALQSGHTGGFSLIETSAVVATVAMALFAIALIVDGFLLADIARQAATSEALLPAVERTHDFALAFFAPAIFLLFVAMGLAGARMHHGKGIQRPVGLLGMAIAIVAITAYLLGWAGPNWSNMQIGGSLIMGAFLWHIIVGAFGLLLDR